MKDDYIKIYELDKTEEQEIIIDLLERYELAIYELTRIGKDREVWQENYENTHEIVSDYFRNKGLI